MFNKRFLFLIVIFSLSFLSISWALIEPTELTNNETAIFNSTFFYCNYRILVEEPSKSYVENPEYVTIISEFCNSSARKKIITGHVTIPSDFPKGSAAIVFNGLNYPSESLLFEGVNVNNHNLDWKYKFSISNNESNWNKSNFNDSSWSSGEMPFGTSAQFGNYIKTSWTANSIYVRKIVNLSSNIQANLRVTVENNAVCWVNGNKVLIINNNLVGINLKRCTGTYYANYYANGKWYDRSYDTSSYFYRGSSQIDISKYLHPGENIIACTASVNSKVFSNTYGGRRFLNVEFLPLREKDIFWSKENNEFTNTNYNLTYTFKEYSCKKTGCNNGADNCYTYKYRYDLNFASSWQWSNLPITDNTRFYGHPERYTNEGGWSTAKMIYPVLPYNGSTTYYRKWVWSDENIIKMLRVTDTKKPTCYINGELLSLEDYNHNYWQYITPINLIQGHNLISCSSDFTQINLFDIDIAGFKEEIRISNVSLEQLGKNKISIDISNLAHPDVNTALGIEIWDDENLIFEEYKLINSAETWQEKGYIGFKEIHTKTVDDPSNSALDKLVTYSENASNSQKAFDGDWVTSTTKINGRPSMSFEENYTFVPIEVANSISKDLIFATWNIKATTNSAKIDFLEESGVWAEGYNNKLCANNACSNPQSKNFDIMPFIFNDSFHVKTIMSDGSYFEGKLDLGYIFVVEYWTLLERSNTNDYFEVELKPGNYNLIITAADLITGDIATYSAEINIEEDTTAIIKNVGFLPISGSYSEKNSAGKNGVSFLIVSGIVAGAIATAGAYIYNKNSGTNLKISLKQIEKSISKTDTAIAKLNSIFYQSKSSNQATFFSTVQEKYVAFKDYLSKLTVEEKEVEGYIEEERARQKAYDFDQNIKLQNRQVELMKEYELVVSDAKDFMKSKVTEDFLNKYGHELTAEARRTLLQNKEYFASTPIKKNWSANASSIEGRQFREQYRLTDYTMNGLVQSGLAIQGNMGYIFNQELMNKIIKEKNKNQETRTTALNEQKQEKSWLDKFTGAVSGFGRFVGLSFEDYANQQNDISNSFRSGDLQGSLSKLANYNWDTIKFLGGVIQENWKEIAVSAVAGLTTGIIIAASGGMGTPLAITIGGAILTAGGIQLGRKYSDPLNALNDIQYKNEERELYEKIRRELTGDAIIIGTGVLSSYVGYNVGTSLKFNVDKYDNLILKGNIEDYPPLKEIIKNLKKKGISVIKDNSILKDSISADYNPQTKVLRYTKETKVGEFFHELVHTTQIDDGTYLTYCKNEIDAYKYELINAKRFGYNVKQIKDINSAIQWYNNEIKYWGLLK